MKCQTRTVIGAGFLLVERCGGRLIAGMMTSFFGLKMKEWLVLLTGVVGASVASAAPRVQPTYANLGYGPDALQVMDVWLVPAVEGAAAGKPVPCVMNIHGGGWLQGNRTQIAVTGGPAAFVKEGIAFVSIDYRFLKQTIIDSGSTVGNGPIQPRGDYPTPPVAVPLGDIARALQFVRSRAKEWNIDPERIGVTGVSAGACSALWLAFHDDMADPKSADPLARQSTKPWCAAVMDAQTTLDPVQILEWSPNNTYGGHAFGYVWDKSDKTVEIRSFLKDREAVKAWIAEYSPYALVTKDDPPVYLYYPGSEPAKGSSPKDPVHSANYGALLAERLSALGMDHEFVYRGVAEPRSKNMAEFLVKRLKR